MRFPRQGGSASLRRVTPARLLPLLLALAAPAAAQPAPEAPGAPPRKTAAPRPAPTARPAAKVAQPQPSAIPAAPALAPPQPAVLSSATPPAAPRPAPPPPPLPPPGMEGLADGSLRLRFAEGAEAPPEGALSGLAALGQRLAAGPAGRVVVTAQTSGPLTDVSTARRISLARALAVKEALAGGGLPPTRIDVRPMGRTAEALDAVDVLPPDPARRAAP